MWALLFLLQILYTQQVQQRIVFKNGGHRMLCECGQYEATIHEVIITDGKKKVERHLCESCARKQGVSSDPYIPINELMSSTNYIMGQVISSANNLNDLSSAEDQAESTKAHPTPPACHHASQSCLGCGQTFASFKESGLLGCPACYQIFEDRIGPMIERAHEGGCNHVGKVPRRALCECKDTQDSNRMDALLGNVRQREERLESLRDRLSRSIHNEEFEQAAMLRDELTRLTSLSASQIEPLPLRSSNVDTNPTA